MRLWRQGLCAGTQWSACVVQHTDSRALPAYRAILMKPPPKPPQPQPLPDGVSDAAEDACTAAAVPHASGRDNATLSKAALAKLRAARKRL